MAKEVEKKGIRRIISLILLCILLFVLAVSKAFEFQIVKGEEYLAAAQKSSFTTVTVEAARGEIVDRNGIPLTKNEAIFNLEFDYSYLIRGEENKLIYNLIKTFEDMREDWIDDLPITQTMPYQFLPDREDDVARLKTRVNVNTYATAQNCMDALYEMSDGRYAKNKEYEGVIGVEYQGYTESYKRRIAGVRYSMLNSDFSAYNTRYTFAEDIEHETVAFMKEMAGHYVGIDIVQKPARTYIGGEVASHVIGRLGKMNQTQLEYYRGLEDSDYTSEDLVGQGGVEEAFESILRGKNGQRRVVKSSTGEVVDVLETIAPEAGKTVKLTIDYTLNKEINRIFADFIADFNETNREDKLIEAGSVVVLDARNGGLLSLSSFPYFDQSEYYNNYNEIAQAEGNPLFNRALQGLYRPGSTFKPIVAAGGFAEDIVTEETKIFCDGVYRFYGTTYQPTCLGTNHLGTSVSTVDALKWSCNIFFYDTGRVMGIDKIGHYAHAFGLGAETGLEISNRVGVISSPGQAEVLGKPWVPGDVAQTSIGQMDTQVTPLQMAVEAMTIGNRGTRYNVHILDSVVSSVDGSVISKTGATVASQIEMTDEAFESIKNGMVAAGETIGGTYSLVELPYKVAVKTGTPEVSNTKTNNAFIAFAPADNPEIAIACMAEDGLYTNRLIKQIIDAYEKNKISAQK